MAPMSTAVRNLFDIARAVIIIERAGILLVEFIENAVTDIGNTGHGLERPNRAGKGRRPCNAHQCCQE